MDIFEGFFFALFWASAAIATKFAIRSINPFTLTLLRFSLVSTLLLGYFYIYKSHKWPTRKEFLHLFVLGLCNITLYMTGYIIAIQNISAGLVSLMMAINPLLVIVFSALFLKKKPTSLQWLGIGVCFLGLIIATVPYLANSYLTFTGIIALLAGITSLAFGSIYFIKANIKLPRKIVNTWQICIGTCLFAPVVCINSSKSIIKVDFNLTLSLIWLVIPVSIIASTLWLNLIHRDPIKATGWLFLTPVLGYIMAIFILNDPVSLYGIIGAILVVIGLNSSRSSGSPVLKTP